MFNIDRWREIFETISKNMLRTALAGFTVSLGIIIFVVLYGLGNGLENTFQKFFKNDQLNTISINPGRTSKPYAGFESNRRIEFDNDDLAEISEKFSFFIEGISPRIGLTGRNISYKLNSNNYSVIGVSPSFQNSEMTIMMNGRYFNQADIINKERYIVIGRLVKQDLFGDEDAIGKYINGGGRTWKVIGVFQDDGGDREERIIYAPYTTIQSIQRGSDKVGSLILTYRPEIGFDGAVEFEKQLKSYIKNRKKIDPSDPRGVFIRSASSDLKENQDFTSALKIIISFVGFGTLLAGVIGISNIMVYVVRERTKELGIRKAIGATPKSIVWMVLQESIFITTISGYMGMFAGILFLSSLGNKLEEDFYITDPYVDFNTALFATIMLIIFGGIAGFIPARRAAKIKPIEALNDK